MRFPYKIVKNPHRPTVERTIKLDLFYTFPSGEQLFTYAPSDLTKISGRYIDKVKQDISFLMEYGASKKAVEIYEEKAIELINAGLNGTIPKGEVLAKLKAQFDERKILYRYNKDLNRQVFLDLYCMFFVLDIEPELMFTPVHNQQKIDLLETLPPEDQEIFFSHLESVLMFYNKEFNNVIQSSILTEMKALEAVDSLKGLTNISDFLSTWQGGQT